MAVEDQTQPFATHEVLNQAVPLENHNPYELDLAMVEGVKRGNAQWYEDKVKEFGAITGRPDTIEKGFQANRNKPELRTHDRFGHRIDEAAFHPAYHDLFALGIQYQMHALPWNEPREGAFVGRAAIHNLLTQIEAGVGCPITMTFAAVPALRTTPEIADEWVPRLTSTQYDPSMRPAPDKAGCTMGMAMTEKQGGSDVRANTTRAEPIGAGGPGGEYFLTGHKWFCSAPMCDAFLTLAQTENGLSCFLVPRWLPDGTRNRFAIQRLKDKLGNHSNASSEIEYQQTWARMVGEEGRGVPTIIEMVNHTRLDCVIGSTALMRQAVTQALHHTTYRSAFGALLKDQPLMQNVLADLAIESEAATTLMMRLSQMYDEAAADESHRPGVRIMTAISKYWVCKRGPGVVYEALECLGGAGYVEEGIMPRLYREIPLASIWEGSGNVMCLDVLRAMAREPETIPALLAELQKAAGANKHYDAALAALQQEVGHTEEMQRRARRLVEQMAMLLQACQLVQFAPSEVSEAFCATRLAGEGGQQYGTLPAGVPMQSIIERAYPPASN